VKGFMDWSNRMNEIMRYIDEHITEEIDMHEIAKIACSSVNHFQRIFAFTAGISLKEYSRRRRLSLAALELQESNIKIIDLAMKYGYDSPDSFTRAFQKMHGITPTLARTTDMKLKSCPKLTFQLDVMGETPLSYRILKKEGFELIGKGIMLDTDNMTEEIQAFWQESYSKGICKKLYQLSKGEILFDVIAYQEDADNRISFHIAYENKVKLQEVTKNYEILKIPASTWVVFTLEEPITFFESSLEEATQYTEVLWNKAYNEWLPASGYMDATPIIEAFYSDRVELWIPVKKKRIEVNI